MLVNPICIVGFAFASYLFFNDRIPHEEELLVEFFGEAYIEYALKTPICLPFVDSFIKEEDFKEMEEGEGMVRGRMDYNSDEEPL